MVRVTENRMELPATGRELRKLKVSLIVRMHHLLCPSAVPAPKVLAKGIQSYIKRIKIYI